MWAGVACDEGSRLGLVGIDVLTMDGLWRFLCTRMIAAHRMTILSNVINSMNAIYRYCSRKRARVQKIRPCPHADDVWVMHDAVLAGCSHTYIRGTFQVSH